MRDAFVTVATTTRFALELRGVAATEELTPRAPHTVTLRGTLRFAATGDLPVALYRSTRTGHGMVELAPSVALSRVQASGAQDARAEVDAGDVRFQALRLPCDSLVLGVRESLRETRDYVEGDRTYWISASRSLRLQRGPGRGPIVVARLAVREFVTLVRIARRAEWSRVRWSSGTGTSLEGWVRQRELAPVPPGDRGSTGGSGIGRCIGIGTHGGVDVYVGPARVHFAASVRDRPNGSTWATTDTAEPVEVAHWAGQPWVQLRRVPDFSERCGYLQHAWLALSDVDLPRNAHPSASSMEAGATASASAPHEDTTPR